MGFLNLFGTVLAGAALAPLALLPPSCTVTTETNLPVETGIRTSTLTYNGPFGTGAFIPFVVSLSTYTVVVPTQGPGGVIQSQTYTLIASPIVDVTPPTSTPSPSPPLTTDVPNSTYVGCFKSQDGRPILYGPSAIRDTQEACRAFCVNALGGPFRYFSIKPISTCQCGQVFSQALGQSPGQCTTGCAGNITQQCGGPADDTSVWVIPPIFRPPPGPPDRDPSFPGDGVEPGRPYPKPPVHEKPHPPPKSPIKYQPHPQHPRPSKGHNEEYGHVDSGYPTYMI